MDSRLNCFLQEHTLQLLEKVSKGFSSFVFKVKDRNGKAFALKIEHSKSPRQNMALKEKLFLEKANFIGIGPKLVYCDLENRIVLMEFIEGIPFGKWVFDSAVSKKQLQKVIVGLLEQAKKLDELGLDHGQLAGKGKNIIVKPCLKPVIIDFEKASLSRKVHNRTQLESFLFKNPHSEIAKQVKKVLE